MYGGRVPVYWFASCVLRMVRLLIICVGGLVLLAKVVFAVACISNGRCTEKSDGSHPLAGSFDDGLSRSMLSNVL